MCRNPPLIPPMRTTPVASGRGGGLRVRYTGPMGHASALRTGVRLLLALLVCSAGMASAQERPLQPGDPAPAFTLPGSDGATYSLSDFLGVRPVVIAWFPKAFATL